MATLLVTVAWRGRRRDFAVPADVPIADLLRPLAAAMRDAETHPASTTRPGATTCPGATTRPASAHPAGETRPGGGAPECTAAGMEAPALGSPWARPARVHPSPELALAPLGGAPLPAHTTLAVCGVGHG